MLAKIVWRLLKDKSSLFYRVFKAKYFPRGSIFEASAANGSYAWQSILKSRKVISMGRRWRIGDGKNIDIYKDNWLLGKGSARIVSPHVQVLEGAQVAALINPEMHTWNTNLLHQHFLSFEANRIKAIPLCWTDQRDRFVWPDNQNGEYLVRASWVRTEHPHLQDMQDLINLVGQRANKLEIFGVVAWFIWNQRNKLRLNERGLPSEKIFDAARVFLSDFQSKFQMPKVQQPKRSIKWQPPGYGMYKTNYDGAVFAESEEAGIGVIIRDVKGLVIAALAEKIPYLGSVEVLEALAARRAARFVVELGLNDFEFEGDSEVVWRASRTADEAHSSMGEIIKDTLSIVGSLLTFSFSHTRRQGNCAAHAFAKRAIISFSLLVWMEHVPTDISHVVSSDFPVT
ncbi:hypothetical protein SO802_008228 [Lithocarpus litseifolius]|uniref:RNase H type-1 domain-containing protein n=1 Tax=Lithocarpus litseifolius TaxID=425828 RepID=A0AAW2DDI5_9ROSI